jgi:GntR family transcriptional repressor for pyruvate dehydrogenase complex
MALQLLKVRQMFEPEIARVAARSRTDDDLKEIEETLNDLRACDHADHEVEGVIDNSFHTLVARSCHNAAVPLLVEPVFSLLPRMRLLVGGVAAATDDQMLQYHERILASITHRDGNAAAKFMEDHLRVIEETFLKSLQSQ